MESEGRCAIVLYGECRDDGILGSWSGERIGVDSRFRLGRCDCTCTGKSGDSKGHALTRCLFAVQSIAETEGKEEWDDPEPAR